MLLLALALIASQSRAADQDGDGVPDEMDNCTLVPNPTQCDSDGDGYGNRCDGDLNNNGATNAQDVILLRAQLGQPSLGPTYSTADLNCNGAVNAQDVGFLRVLLGKPPGPAAAAFGLDQRPANTTCIAPPRPTLDAQVATVDAYPSAPAFTEPTKIIQAPGDGSRWFVLEKGGLIRTFSVSNPAAVTNWLDFRSKVRTDSEGGMLGLAFHPNYPATPEVYVSYTGSPATAMVSKISRVILDNVTTPANITEQVLLQVDQPYSNHNGGDIAFGPDGFLYVGFGDGGSGGDPQNNARNPTRLLGKMLRINVLGVAFPSPGYTIPANNPYAANPRCGAGANALACPEIYASGLRNPWRWSFDGPTGQLWAGDVGQDAWEEVDVIERGGDYGWRCREATHGYNGSGCPAGGLTEPLTEYAHSAGNASITGGYVYRGTGLPALQGRYVFADFASGRIWRLQPNGQGGYANDELVDTPYAISAFGADAASELYIADYGNGRIRRLVAAGPATPDTMPASLGDTGCVLTGDQRQPAPGLVPYGVSAPFWSDGAAKTRYLALPDGATIDLEAGSGQLDLPPGSVVVKNFALNGSPVETRLLMRHPDGIWAGYTYEWNTAGTQASRVIGGKTRQVNGQTWIYPSEGDCMSCHTQVAGFSLGLTTAQLNGPLTYPTTGRTANQLATLEHIGMLSAPLPAPPASLPMLPDPGDTSQPLANRARAWLQTNCAQCHQPGGPTPSSMDLRYATTLAASGTCNTLPQAGDLGIPNARLIAPGDAARSVVVARMGRRDASGMPPVGSALVDTAGVTLLTAWINALPGC
jgi:uncharacterized repeat protein (TIGR03806 family)